MILSYISRKQERMEAAWLDLTAILIARDPYYAEIVL